MSVYITSRRHESEVFMNLTSLSLSSTCMYGLLLAYSWRNAVVPCLCTMHLYHTIDNSSFNTLQLHYVNAYAFTIQVGLTSMMFFLSVKLVASKYN